MRLCMLATDAAMMVWCFLLRLFQEIDQRTFVFDRRQQQVGGWYVEVSVRWARQFSVGRSVGILSSSHNGDWIVVILMLLRHGLYIVAYKYARTGMHATSLQSAVIGLDVECISCRCR